MGKWEPEDKYKKNPVRTYWRRHEEQKDDIEQEEEPVKWWEEQHVGYLEEGDDLPVFQWSEEILRAHKRTSKKKKTRATTEKRVPWFSEAKKLAKMKTTASNAATAAATVTVDLTDTDDDLSDSDDEDRKEPAVKRLCRQITDSDDDRKPAAK